ncbi:MAG TPA: c-type cytochrome [Opitutaceae bacterium]|nr:c-type cytochrome [Opitutaceae bacterium]
MITSRNVSTFLAGTTLLVSSRLLAAETAPPAGDLLTEGRRLVENVGLCSDCHTARLPTGEFDRTRWLQGSQLPFEPTVDMPWSSVAPGIAGLRNYTDAEAVTFLTTGTRTAGPLRPPMPQYRFSEAEARAIVAYLRSLPTTQ